MTEKEQQRRDYFNAWQRNKYATDPEYREKHKKNAAESRRRKLAADPEFKARVYEQQRQYRLRKKARLKAELEEVKAKVQYARKVLRD